jgi:hypothetical protein
MPGLGKFSFKKLSLTKEGLRVEGTWQKDFFKGDRSFTTYILPRHS